VDRQQSCFLPPRVEDYVDLRNPVRAIDAFAEGLDYVALGFRTTIGAADPAART
jgi:hypothetical protein